jgi:hypothetical protein
MLTIAASFIVVCNSCNVVGNIPGNIAGQVMNEGGQGRGFVAVQLVNVETGQVWGTENTDDKGSYMLKNVDPGKYILKVLVIGGSELPTDCEEFSLSPGKTLKKDLIIQDAPEG